MTVRALAISGRCSAAYSEKRRAINLAASSGDGVPGGGYPYLAKILGSIKMVSIIGKYTA